MKKYIKCLFVVLLVINSCVYPYNPKLEPTTFEVLVLEGDIIIGKESVFTLTRLSSLVEDESETGIITIQEGVIEDSEGNIFIGTISGNTCTVDTRNCSTDIEYKLKLKIEGDTYETDFAEVLITPKIDAVTWTAEEYYGVKMYVTTYGTPEQSPYYKWNFVEDWEHLPYGFSQYIYHPETNSFSPKPNPDPRDYCWGHAESKEIIIDNTTSLTENSIKNKNLNYIHYQNTRLNYLYRVRLYQMSLSQAGYNFLDMMKKNTNDIGGLFTHQPTEITGNISCTTSDKVIVGFVNVSTQEMVEIYLERDDHKVFRYIPCEINEKEPKDMPMFPSLWYSGWDIFFIDPMTHIYSWIEKRCVDCRLNGGTKNKPSDWPNDHQ